MNILIDMNLSPEWADTFAQIGWHAVHWSSVGDPKASDHSIMEWARVNHFVVITHDLDFGAILAATKAEGPSVILVRAQDVLPSHLGSIVVDTLLKNQRTLEAGALIVVDEVRSRVRILPFRR